jgi:DNA polymerase III subunit epsilon
LIDSELLAEVCVELAGGRQFTMFTGSAEASETTTVSMEDQPRLSTFILAATAEEQERHAALVAKLGENSIWAKLEATE